MFWSFIISLDDLCCTLLRAPWFSSLCFANPAQVWVPRIQLVCCFGLERAQRWSLDKPGWEDADRNLLSLGLISGSISDEAWVGFRNASLEPGRDSFVILVRRSQSQTLPSRHHSLSSKQPAPSKHYALKLVWSLPRANRKFWIHSHGNRFLKCFPCP